jgi:RNA polymerase-binding transcription factor DksA
MHLRIVSVRASDLHGARRGGSVVLEELCEARKLTPCLGLAECDVLPIGQKLELLVERATRMREEEGDRIELRGVSPERLAEIDELRDELIEEREAIVEENQRREAEIAAAIDRELEAHSGQEGDLTSAGLSIELEASRSELRVERLDEIDRTLEAMDSRSYGVCARCGGDVPIERLRLSSGTRVCGACAVAAPAPRPPRPRRPARAAKPAAGSTRPPPSAGPAR